MSAADVVGFTVGMLFIATFLGLVLALATIDARCGGLRFHRWSEWGEPRKAVGYVAGHLVAYDDVQNRSCSRPGCRKVEERSL